MAHVNGHCDFFKKNAYFAHISRKLRFYAHPKQDGNIQNILITTF